MNKFKDLSLVFALPLLLIGCGTDEKVESPQTLTQTVSSSETEVASPEFNIDVLEDPIEQVDTINDSIDTLERAEGANLDSVSMGTETTTETPATANLNGLYAYNVNYQTPKGETPLVVSFTLNNDIITEVSLNGKGEQTSNQYQKLIEAELGELIVGKDYATVSALPSKLSGSSLTPTAFNRALAELQAEA